MRSRSESDESYGRGAKRSRKAASEACSRKPQARQSLSRARRSRANEGSERAGLRNDSGARPALDLPVRRVQRRWQEGCHPGGPRSGTPEIGSSEDVSGLSMNVKGRGDGSVVGRGQRQNPGEIFPPPFREDFVRAADGTPSNTPVKFKSMTLRACRRRAATPCEARTHASGRAREHDEAGVVAKDAARESSGLTSGGSSDRGARWAQRSEKAGASTNVPGRLRLRRQPTRATEGGSSGQGARFREGATGVPTRRQQRRIGQASPASRPRTVVHRARRQSLRR